MNIFDRTYADYHYADNSTPADNDSLSPELKYVLLLEKKFSDNVAFACIYCTLLANFLLSLDHGLIKKDRHVSDGLKSLVIKYFSAQKDNSVFVKNKEKIIEVSSELVKSSTYLILQLADRGLLIEGLKLNFVDVFNSIPENMNISVKASKLCVTEYGKNFILDYARILRIPDEESKRQKMSSLVNDVIKVILNIYDNRNLKVR